MYFGADTPKQFGIGKEIFKLSEEEKLKYRSDLENGSYNGYKPRGTGEVLPGKPDNVEMYNLFKFSKCFDIQPNETVMY